MSTLSAEVTWLRLLILVSSQAVATIGAGFNFHHTRAYLPGASSPTSSATSRWAGVGLHSSHTVPKTVLVTLFIWGGNPPRTCSRLISGLKPCLGTFSGAGMGAWLRFEFYLHRLIVRPRGSATKARSLSILLPRGSC